MAPRWARPAAYLLLAAGSFAVAAQQYALYSQPTLRYCTSPVLYAPFPCDVGAAGVAVLFALAGLVLLVMAVRAAPRRAHNAEGFGGGWD